MTGARLLEVNKQMLGALESHGLGTPSLIASEIGRDRRYVANRLRYLCDLGLVEKVARALYRRAGKK